MKKFSLTILLLTAVLYGFAQPPTIKNSLWQFRNKLTQTPFYATRVQYERAEPRSSADFPDYLWKGQLKANAWNDWQLTQPKEYADFYPSPSIHRRFAPENGKFIVFAATIGNPFQYNEFICTSTESGILIDNIEGGFRYADENAGEEGGFVFLKQYTVTADMNVVVYHIIPEVNRNIATEGNPSFFRGKRVDTIYKIDSDGKFVKIKEMTYKPTTYTLNNLADKSKNIWEGKEEIASTQTF